MTFRRFDICPLILLFLIVFWPASAWAQSAQAPPTQNQAAAPVPNPTTAVPDYPDPRTFTIGVSYWVTTKGTQPDLRGGKQAFDYETLTDLGKPKDAPGIELSYPISRTGSLHFEIFQLKGDGTQNAPALLDLFGTGYSQGDTLATQYQLLASKIYLDDLLFPHKFPVAKFRLKSLWEFQYVHMKTTIDAPLLDLTAPETAVGTKQILLPTFGLAAEYAIAKHVLLRVDGSGFGIPHKALLWDAAATIAYRRGAWELVAGGKAFHFKTSPNSDEYLTDTITGAFVGLRWHWSL